MGIDGQFRPVFGPDRPGRSRYLCAEGLALLHAADTHYLAAKRADLLATAKDLFGVVLSGEVKITLNQAYPLKDAADAHRDLESRKTIGSTVLAV